MNPGKFSVNDDKVKNITVTVRDVTTNDAGTYWCGAAVNRSSNQFFLRFLMNVGESTR